MRNQMLHAHIGLSQDPVAAKRAAPTITDSTVIKLPYMGPHKYDTAARVTEYPTEELKFRKYEERELGNEAERPPEFTDPCDILMRKIESLSRMLGCSEQDAEALLFDRL